MRRLALILVLAGQGAAADVFDDLIAREGCAVGPPVLERAADAGLDPTDVTARAGVYLITGQAEEVGDWIVLGPEACTLSPPEPETSLTLDDPLVQSFVAPDGSFEDHGCFLVDPVQITDLLVLNRGMEADAATRDYRAFLATGLARGELTFFSADPLRTPPSFQVMTGDCAGLGSADEIAAARAWRDANFDRLLRLASAELPCDPDISLMDLGTLPEARLDEAGNAFVLFEVFLIALGAGWIEGAGPTEKGQPRPPLCNPALDAG